MKRSRRAISSSRAGSVPVATSTLRRCARTGVCSRRSSSPWQRSRPLAAMPDRTAATRGLASQRSAVPGGSVAASASLSGLSAAARAGQQFPQPQFQQAAGALARPRAVRAGRAVGERGDGAVTADRFRHRARADRAGLAAAGAPACSPWQAGHHGSAVSREVPQDRIWSQTEHSSTGSGGQPGQNGPSGLRVFTTRRDRSSRRPRS